MELLVDRAVGDGPTLVLAHGAGAPMDSDFLQHLSAQLVACGVTVCRFEFPYMAERRLNGKKRPPNRQPELIESWMLALEQVTQRFDGPVFIGGKSMGGRMAAVVAASVEVRGLICFGYPFHPPGKPDKLRVDTLQQLRVQTLIVQGTRDKLGDRHDVESYDLPANIALHWLADGDHDFKPRVRSGYTQDQHIVTAAQAAAGFIINAGD
ncbi:alpha/beta family hydrolase [Gilvimarinus polysaccharolyticus]|uniref:alpha/beta family hydrolase n=1 Tax=Gilvimarinus polysaccharolyticus TaxID=863921 RepID=UPI00067334D0|nr:alpha/beta family hydrolase [Gilvimarinus polysaccharolyticus]